tara:strand:- start:766 stop:2325 length:1560 start_codon:yes stop_codon:yes gene_type:complete
MANTGYGLRKYGRSLYGALTYHDLEASVSANASISVAPSLNFSIPSQPINAIGSITSNINHIFVNQDVGINPTTSVTTIGQKVNQGIPNAIIQNSGHLVHATQVDQPEADIFVNPTIASVGTQIDLVAQQNINAVSSIDVFATPIDDGATSIVANTSSSAVGIQIDLASVDPIVNTTTTAVGTQIDLGASTDSVTTVTVGTENPIFNNLDKALSIVSAQYTNQISIEGSSLLPLNRNINFLTNDSAFTGKNIGISKVQSGRHNTNKTHISFKTDTSGNTYLQVSGASLTQTAGGVATDTLRTVYKFLSDTSSTPSYTGSAWAYIYVKNIVTVDEGVNVSIGYQLVSGYNILTIGGRPVYQYIGDSDDTTANGIISGWEAIDKDGNSQQTSKTTTADDSLLVSGIGATKTGTDGQPGAKVTINKSVNTSGFIYSYDDSSLSNASFSLDSTVSTIESVMLLTGGMQTSANSTLESIGIRRYFLGTNIQPTSSISIDGKLKWIKQSVPNTSWTEQKLQRHNN